MSSRSGTVYFYQNTARQPGMPKPKKKRLAPNPLGLWAAGPVANWHNHHVPVLLSARSALLSLSFLSPLPHLTSAPHSHPQPYSCDPFHLEFSISPSFISQHSMFHCVIYLVIFCFLCPIYSISTTRSTYNFKYVHDVMSMIPSMQFPPELLQPEEAVCLINGLRNRIVPESDMELNCVPILFHSLCRFPPLILPQTGSRSRDSTVFVSQSTPFTLLIPSTAPSPMPLPYLPPSRMVNSEYRLQLLCLLTMLYRPTQPSVRNVEYSFHSFRTRFPVAWMHRQFRSDAPARRTGRVRAHKRVQGFEIQEDRQIRAAELGVRVSHLVCRARFCIKPVAASPS